MNRFWFDRKRIYLRITVTPCKGIWNLGNFSLGIWNKGQVLWIPLITGIRNASSTDKESRMQYPWRRIENPRLSDFLAWADHCFQFDKIKDIMYFNFFFATIERLTRNMQVFHFWESFSNNSNGSSSNKCSWCSRSWASLLKCLTNFYFSMFTCLRFTFLQNVELRVLFATPLFSSACCNIPYK